MPRQIRARINRTLLQIFLGDDSSTSRNDADDQSFVNHWNGLSRLHSDEGGKVTLITTITMMFFLILVCYIGNVGISIKQKLELQNAADSAAYSAVLWQARGMNAITVSNHMMGEASAIVVMLESIGGRLQTDQIFGGGGKYTSSESQYYNSQIETLQPLAPMTQPLRQLDAKIVDFVADLMTDDDGDHSAGATIYDAKLTLKYAYTLVLVIKSACTIGAAIGEVFPPLIALKIVFNGIDIAMTLGPVLKIAQEWLFLEALEGVSLLAVPFHRGVETTLIPAISIYGATAAGQSPLSPGSSLGLSDTVVNRATKKTLDDLGDFYGGQDIELAIVPGISKWEMPVQEEEAPPDESNSDGVANVGSWQMPPSEWEEPFFTGKFMNGLDKTLAQVSKVTGAATRIIKWILDLAEFIPGFNTGPVKEAREKVNQVLDILGMDIRRPNYRRGYPENPCHHESSDHKLAEFYWQHERKSQWVRATYPYVESFREPMVKWMKDGWAIFNLNISNAATYYTHWSNRYTLAKSYEIRSGKFGAGGIATPKMFIMKDSDSSKKGYEAWTNGDAEAESLFVVYAVAYRPQEKAHFASKLFAKTELEGSVAFSAAMLYNANGRNVPAQGSGYNPVQLNNGWDTLNWLPAQVTHEWGSHKPSMSGGNDPWRVFGGNKNANNGSKVQINWQSKLVPITLDGQAPAHFEKGLDDIGDDLSAEAKELVEKALEEPSLITH